MSIFKIGDNVEVNAPNHPNYHKKRGTVLKVITRKRTLVHIRPDENPSSYWKVDSRMLLKVEDSAPQAQPTPTPQSEEQKVFNIDFAEVIEINYVSTDDMRDDDTILGRQVDRLSNLTDILKNVHKNQHIKNILIKFVWMDEVDGYVSIKNQKDLEDLIEHFTEKLINIIGAINTPNETYTPLFEEDVERPKTQQSQPAQTPTPQYLHQQLWAEYAAAIPKGTAPKDLVVMMAEFSNLAAEIEKAQRSKAPALSTIGFPNIMSLPQSVFNNIKYDISEAFDPQLKNDPFIAEGTIDNIVRKNRTYAKSKSKLFGPEQYFLHYFDGTTPRKLPISADTYNELNAPDINDIPANWTPPIIAVEPDPVDYDALLQQADDNITLRLLMWLKETGILDKKDGIYLEWLQIVFSEGLTSAHERIKNNQYKNWSDVVDTIQFMFSQSQAGSLKMDFKYHFEKGQEGIAPVEFYDDDTAEIWLEKIKQRFELYRDNDDLIFDFAPSVGNEPKPASPKSSDVFIKSIAISDIDGKIDSSFLKLIRNEPHTSYRSLTTTIEKAFFAENPESLVFALVVTYESGNTLILNIGIESKWKNREQSVINAIQYRIDNLLFEKMLQDEKWNNHKLIFNPSQNNSKPTIKYIKINRLFVIKEWQNLRSEKYTSYSDLLLGVIELFERHGYNSEMLMEFSVHYDDKIHFNISETIKIDLNVRQLSQIIQDDLSLYLKESGLDYSLDFTKPNTPQ